MSEEQEELLEEVETEDLVEVEIEDEPEEKSAPLSPREAAIEAMAKNRAEEDKGTIVNALGEELGEELSDEEYDEADPEPPKPEPESPVFLNDDGEHVMKLVVNGSEVIRPLNEIVADSQKNLAANQRLQEVAEQRKRIEARENELLQREAALKEQSLLQQKPQPSIPDVGEGDLDKAKAFIDRILDGETDNAAEQLAELIVSGRQQPTPIDTDAISKQAARDAIAQMESVNSEREYRESIGKGAKWVNEHHPEITASESLTRFVDAEIEAIMANEPNTMPEDAIKQATEGVLKYMGKPAQEASSRETNKTGLHREPVRKSLSKKRPEPEVIDNSPTAIIAQLRKERQMIAGRSS